MFRKEYPDQNTSSDATFFSNGIRLSNDFVDREALENATFVSIYVNENEHSLGFNFTGSKRPQSLKLTPSGENTKGKTISCAFLKKKYSWIRKLMEDKDIKKRRYNIRKLQTRSKENEPVKYAIDIKT